MEKVQRKRKKDDERHERKKGKKESSKSSASAASDSNNTSASRRSPLDASTEKDARASATSRNEVDDNVGEEGKDNADAKDKDGEACMRQSPEPNCSICLSKLENKSFTDSCFHTFCFVCLLEWSKIKTECPLCKQPFKSIIHNVRSYDDYDQYDVQKQDIPDERRFRYRTTLTVDRLLALQTPRGLGEIQDNIYGSRSHMTTRHSSRRLQQQQLQQQQQQQLQQQHRRLQYSRHSLDFRRNVYRNNLQIVKGRNSGRYRNTKPDFLQKNPTAIHRLAPWLERELNVLLRHQESHVPFVMELILDLIKRYPISSEEFYQHILPFVGRNTSHFMHEFENFAKSAMPDMRSYDENMQYVPFTQLVDSNTDASSTDDDDDDVIVLSPRETTTAMTATTSGNQSSISVSISLGHPSQQIVMKSSSWDKQSSDKSQAESSASNGQTSTSGWESPQPGPSGVLPSSIMETTNAATESTSAEQGPASESTSKQETSKRRRIESSTESNESDVNGEGENNAEEDDSDVVITGYEKPWADRSPILISDLDDGSDVEEEAEQVAEKSEEANPPTRSSASVESHRSGEGLIKRRSSSAQNERSHRKSRHDKYSSSSTHSKERRKRGHNLHSSNTPSLETTLYSKRISSRSRSKSRSASRSRHSKSKSSGSGYSTKERKSHRQRHRDDSPTSSSSSLQLHISQRSIICPLSYSNLYRVGCHPRRSTLTEHSSSACDYESYSHSRSHRKHRSSYTPASPVRHPPRARSRSSSVEIIACKRQRRSHKKHKKHKHRKHHRSKHSSSKVSSSACGSISDSNFASGGSDVVPISPPPASMYKKHHSGYKNSHLKQRIPTSPSTDDVHIIATVHGDNRPFLDKFQKYANSLHRNSSSSTTAAAASCSQSSFMDIFAVSPLGSPPSSPLIDAETIGADVVIPSEGNDCQVDLGVSMEEKANNDNDMLTKTISVPVSTCGTLDEINDPDLKLMIPDLMDMRPNSPSSPSTSKPDCMQANGNTSTTSAAQIGLSSCALDSSKWLPLSLSAEQRSPPANPDCRYGGKNPEDFCSYIGQGDRSNSDTSKPSATVTLGSSKSSHTSNSSNLNIVSSVFSSCLMSSDSNSSSSSSAISVTDHDPINHNLKPFSMSPTSSLGDTGPSTSMANFHPLPLQAAFDDHEITAPMSSTVDTLNRWTSPQEQEKEEKIASDAEKPSSSDNGNPCSRKETSSTSLLDTLSTICSTSAAKLPDPADNKELRKSNLLPLFSTPAENWLSSSSSSSLSTLAAAASLSIVSPTSAPNTELNSDKTVCNTTSTTTNTTTTTSEIFSPFNSSFTTVPTTATTTTTTTSSVSPVATTSALSSSLMSPERKAREEAICTDNDIQSIISEVFALNSQSDNIPPQRERMRSPRSPSPSFLRGEQKPNSGTYNQDQSPTPSTHQGKLLIDMGDGNYDKKLNVDDDFSDSDSSSSNLMSFLNKNRMQQPQNATLSTSEAKQRKMTSSPSSPGSDNKSQGDGMFEYSSLNLTSNKKSPLKLTFKRLKSFQDSTPEDPSGSHVSQLSASSSQSGFSSDCGDSESSNQGGHSRAQTSSSQLELDQKPSVSKELVKTEILNDFSFGRTNKTDSFEKPNPDSLAMAPKDSAHSPYQTDPATNRSSQDKLFDGFSSEESNIQSCKDPDFPGLQSSAAGSPPQTSKPLGGLVGHQVSKPPSQESSQVEGHSEESSSGSEELNIKACESSNHAMDYKTIRSSELHSQGDISDEFHSGVDGDDHDLFSSSDL